MSWRRALLRLAGIRAKEVSKTYTRMTIPRKRADMLGAAIEKVRASAWREGATIEIETIGDVTLIKRSDGRTIVIRLVD